MRQQKMLQGLLDDLFGKLGVSKWALMTKCPTDPSLRDIQDLLKKAYRNGNRLGEEVPATG